MVWWAPLAIQAGVSLLGGISGKKDAKHMAGLKRQAVEETSEERIRRRTLEQGQELGAGIATAGFSGTGLVEGSGYARVLSDMQAEFGKEIAWMKRSAEFEKLGVDAELRSAKHAIGFQALQNMTSGLLMSGQSKGWW